jgi:hypothetical protein
VLVVEERDVLSAERGRERPRDVGLGDAEQRRLVPIYFE